MNYIAHTGARRPAGGYKNPNYDPEEAHRYYEEHKKLKGRGKTGPGPTSQPRNQSSKKPDPVRNTANSGTKKPNWTGVEEPSTAVSIYRSITRGDVPGDSKKPNPIRNAANPGTRKPSNNRQSLRSEPARVPLRTPSSSSSFSRKPNNEIGSKKPTFGSGARSLRSEPQERTRAPKPSPKTPNGREYKTDLLERWDLSNVGNAAEWARRRMVLEGARQISSLFISRDFRRMAQAGEEISEEYSRIIDASRGGDRRRERERERKINERG